MCLKTQSHGGRSCNCWGYRRRGHRDIVALLVKIDTVDVNHRDRYGRTALMRACKPGFEQIVAVHIEEGFCNIEATNTKGRHAVLCSVLELTYSNGHSAERGSIDREHLRSELPRALALRCQSEFRAYGSASPSLGATHRREGRPWHYTSYVDDLAFPSQCCRVPAEGRSLHDAHRQ